MAEMCAIPEEAIEIGCFLRDQIWKIARDYENDRPRWTGAIQRALHTSLLEKKFGNGSEVLPPIDPEKPSSRKNEFLVDFVLWRRDFEGSQEGAWIACESEWDQDVKGIEKDFDKLLSFRAPYKVMVYGANNRVRLGENCREIFRERLSRFRWNTRGEAYIFIEFVEGDEIAKVYTCFPESDCKLLNLAGINQAYSSDCFSDSHWLGNRIDT
jgi:hypothetical protein